MCLTKKGIIFKMTYMILIVYKNVKSYVI